MYQTSFIIGLHNGVFNEVKDSYVADKASLVPKLWVRYDSFSETYNPVLGYADCILEKYFTYDV